MKPKPISRDHAARAFEVCAGMDPQGVATPQSVAGAGQCFALEAPTGRVVYALELRQGGAAWIHAAAGQGGGMTAAGLEAVEQQARAAGCAWVGFQTMRRGLVKLAQARGYAVDKIGGGYRLQRSI